MVGVSDLYKIVVYGGEGRISRVETTVGRLTRGEQRVIIGSESYYLYVGKAFSAPLC